MDAQTQRFDDAAADFKFKRVVTKQAEVAGAAARRDAGRDRCQAAHGSMFGQRIEIGSFRDFERCAEAGGLGGDIADAVINDQCEFGLVWNGEVRINFVEVHSATACSTFGRLPASLR